MFHRLDMDHVVSHKIWKLNANRMSGHQYTIDWSESKTQSSLLAIFIWKSLMPLPSVTLLRVLNLSFSSLVVVFKSSISSPIVKLLQMQLSNSAFWHGLHINLYNNVCLVHCLSQFYLAFVPVLHCGLWLVRETSACWFSSCLQIVRALLACSHKENARCWCFIVCTRLARQSRWSCTGLHTFPNWTSRLTGEAMMETAAMCQIYQQRLAFGWLIY